MIDVVEERHGGRAGRLSSIIAAVFVEENLLLQQIQYFVPF